MHNSLAKNRNIRLPPRERLCWLVNSRRCICWNYTITRKWRRNMPVFTNISLCKQSQYKEWVRSGCSNQIDNTNEAKGHIWFTCFFMKICFNFSALSSDLWAFSSAAVVPSRLLVELLISGSPTLHPLFLELEPACASSPPRMDGSGDSTHSRNFWRPSFSGNAFTTSMALTMPIPLHHEIKNGWWLPHVSAKLRCFK